MRRYVERTGVSVASYGLAAALAVVLLGCAPDHRVVLLKVQGFSDTTPYDTLRLQSYFRQNPTVSADSLDPGLTTTDYQPPPPTISISGDWQVGDKLHVYAEAISADCVGMRGEVDAVIGEDSITTAVLELQPLQSPLCGCSISGWCQEFPAVSVAALLDVFGIGDTLWAVGSRGTIMRSTDAGRTWHKELSPTTATLYGIWGSSDKDLWAVGEQVPAVDGKTPAQHTILHYSEGQWTRITSLDPLLAAVNWNAVWGIEEKVWLVGQGGSAVYHDEDGWHVSYPTSSRELDLASISGSARDDIWVVGGAYEKDGLADCSPGSANYASLALHWDGESWTRLPLPAGTRPLRKVAASGPQRAWAVGGYYCNDTPTGVAMQLAWSAEAGASVRAYTTAPVSDNTWSDVVLDQGGLWLVGGNASTGHAAIVTRTADGEFVPAASIAEDQQFFPTAGWKTSRGLIVAGHAGHISELVGTAVRRVQAVPQGTITALWAAGAQDVWAVGVLNSDKDLGMVLHWDGKSWSDRSYLSGDQQLPSLRAVASSHPSRVFFAGDHGSFWLWNGTRLVDCSARIAELTQGQPLFGLWAASHSGTPSGPGCDNPEDQVWVTGGYEADKNPSPGSPSNYTQGVVLQKIGSTWTSMLPPDLALRLPVFYSVWGSPAGEFWTVGGINTAPWSAVVLHCSAASCRQDGFAQDASGWLLGVYGEAYELYAVSGDISKQMGSVYRRGPRGWDPMYNLSTTTQIADGMSSIWGTGSNDLYAVGGNFMPNQLYSGHLRSFIQSKRARGWWTEDAGTTNNLRTVAGASWGNVWAAGDGPIILRKRLTAAIPCQGACR